ncbi:hypothetical protein GCM10029963_10760 [Micromonospora andamanensis]
MSGAELSAPAVLSPLPQVIPQYGEPVAACLAVVGVAVAVAAISAASATSSVVTVLLIRILVSFPSRRDVPRGRV